MAPPPKITAAHVAEWERLQHEEHLEVGEAAKRVGFSFRGLYGAQVRLGAVAGAKPAGRRATGAKRGSKQRRQVAPPARRSPPPKPAGDVLEELQELFAMTKDQLPELVGTKGYAPVGSLLDKIAARMNAIRLSRRDAGNEMAQILSKGPIAISKIRLGRTALARREAESGRCVRCSGALSEEQIAERKATAEA